MLETDSKSETTDVSVSGTYNLITNMCDGDVHDLMFILYFTTYYYILTTCDFEISIIVF